MHESGALVFFPTDCGAGWVRVRQAPIAKVMVMKKKYWIPVLLVSAMVQVSAGAADKPTAPATAASTDPHAALAISGVVLETKDVEGYTYVRIKTAKGETWAAVEKMPLKVGATVSIQNAMMMTNFESKKLKKVFPEIYFGSIGGADGMPAGHGLGTATKDVTDNVKVAKASGADAQTVADVNNKGPELKGKTVSVRGKVVKFSGGILGKNWIHLRDGTGDAAKKTNDIVVTTAGLAAVGDVVTAKGVVHTDKDLGSGYLFKVIIEDATLQK